LKAHETSNAQTAVDGSTPQKGLSVIVGEGKKRRYNVEISGGQ